jgi:hypothetical protein
MMMIPTSRIPRMMIPVILADSSLAAGSGVGEGEEESLPGVSVGEANENACTLVKASVVPTRKDSTRSRIKKSANRRGMLTDFMACKYIMG